MRHNAGFVRSDSGREAIRHQRPGIHPALFYSMFTLLLTGNALLGTGFLLSSDISKLMSGQNEQVISAYEDRIAQLRVEVDRLHSRSYAQAGDMNLQLQELAQQQEVLLEQHQLVRVLVDKADELGIAAASLTSGGASGGLADMAPVTATGNPDVDATSAAVAEMMGEAQFAITSIAETATERTETILAELDGLGINAELPAQDGMGGPMLAPVGDGNTAPMVDDANAVMAALVRYKAARDSRDGAPIHMPISGNFRNSSGFGNRTDPFTGRKAFHAGMDFAAPTGTTVFAAGAGMVTFVGTKSGYGKVVEVSHANGLLTRYGHLSGFLSEEGQSVQTGTPIAKVGSTGRSTGPHLHFEVRKSDAPINPRAFIEAGKRLLATLG